MPLAADVCQRRRPVVGKIAARGGRGQPKATLQLLNLEKVEAIKLGWWLPLRPRRYNQRSAFLFFLRSGALGSGRATLCRKACLVLIETGAHRTLCPLDAGAKLLDVGGAGCADFGTRFATLRGWCRRSCALRQRDGGKPDQDESSAKRCAAHLWGLRLLLFGKVLDPMLVGISGQKERARLQYPSRIVEKKRAAQRRPSAWRAVVAG